MQIGIGPGKTPYYKRVMVFVDGTNILCQLSEELKIPFEAANPPPEALRVAARLIKSRYERRGDVVSIRNYWFSSYKGNVDYNQLAKELRICEFEPVLFERRHGREKGVDIELATKMLVNAFNQNFDIGILIAGDEDYVGLVNEVKRYGPIIHGAFFRRGLSEILEIACDHFFCFEEPKPEFTKTSPYKELIGELKKACKKSKSKKGKRLIEDLQN